MATKKSTASEKSQTKKTATPAPAKSGEVREFSTTEKIAALYDLQLVDSRIDEINHIKGSLPLEVQDMEDAVTGAEALIAKYATEMENALSAVKIKKEEIEKAKALIAKYEEQQKEVRNNREFESLGKEVEFQNLEIELCEKRIKEFTAEGKSKKLLVDEAGELLKDRQKELAEKRTELEGIEAETADELKDLQVEAEQISTKIDERLLDAYRRIRRNTRNGLAVVTVERDACGGCFNRIPPQRQIDIQASKKVIVCEYCGRVLVARRDEEVE